MTIVPNWAPYQILAGPADVYLAAVATAFPAVNATPDPEDWTNIGRTEGGVNVQHSNTVQLITSDQNTGPIKALRTDEGLEISFSLIELTLENYGKVLNDATVATASTPSRKTINLHQGYNVALFAMLVRSYSPYGAFNGQYQVPVVCQTDQPQVSYTKQDKAVLASTWTALEDLNAATDAERFGQLVAQTS